MIRAHRSLAALLLVLGLAACGEAPSPQLLPAAGAATAPQLRHRLTFEGIPGWTQLAADYANLGVAIEGADAVDVRSVPFQAVSGSMVAYARTGVITLRFRPEAAPTFVTAFITGADGTEMRAFDDAGNVLGTTVPTTSSRDPATGRATAVQVSLRTKVGISRVEVRNPAGGVFAIDDFAY